MKDLRYYNFTRTEIFMFKIMNAVWTMCEHQHQALIYQWKSVDEANKVAIEGSSGWRSNVKCTILVYTHRLYLIFTKSIFIYLETSSDFF